MSAAVFLKRGLGRPLNILEIGSFMGASALTWAQAVDQLLDGPATLLCVDPWDETAKGSPTEPMARAFKSGLAYQMFRTNTAGAPAAIKIDHIRGYGNAVLPTLERSSMDIVYIDGSHAYPHVADDIKRKRTGLFVRMGLSAAMIWSYSLTHAMKPSPGRTRWSTTSPILAPGPCFIPASHSPLASSSARSLVITGFGSCRNRGWDITRYR
jgi:hypothetical protein